MPLTSAAVIGGSSILGGLIGNSAASGDRDAANAARQQALQAFLSIHVPSVAQQKIIMAKYASTGQLDPKLEQAFNQSQTALNNVSVDPSYKAAQQSALAKLGNIASNNGQDAQSQASMTDAMNQANTNEQGNRNAILMNAAQRGIGGSGATLAAQLNADQQSANTSAVAGVNANAAAQSRALQALTQGSSLAGNMSATDYSQQAAKAAATDAINRFNTQNSQGVSNSNASTSNAAQAANLANSQSVANSNVGVTNANLLNDQSIVQQNYQNQLSQAAGESGQYGAVANQNNTNANQTAAMWGGITAGIGQGAAAYGQYANGQKKNADGTPDTPADPNILSDNSNINDEDKNAGVV
jgi:hypothetical protein